MINDIEKENELPEIAFPDSTLPWASLDTIFENKTDRTTKPEFRACSALGV
jgi:hypothetical protein